jgi:hypothetical protein
MSHENLIPAEADAIFFDTSENDEPNVGEELKSGFTPEELRRFLQIRTKPQKDRLSHEDLKDILDSRPINYSQLKRAAEDPNTRYYTDLQAYKKDLIELYGEYEGPQAFIHELMHGKVGERLGLVAVYGIKRVVIPDFQYEEYQGITNFAPFKALPNIALAGIAAAPTEPSETDIVSLYQNGYPSVAYLSDRIEKWNARDHGLKIPMPGTIEID